MKLESKILSRDSDLPLYRQVAKELQSRMESRRLNPGEMLPSESDLVNEFGVSRVTVRQALAELEKHGQIVRRQGKGTFVGATHVNQQLNQQAKTIVEALREKGIEPEVEVLGIDQVVPPQRVSEVFGNSGEKVTRLRRCYKHNGAPIALVYLYLPLAMSGVAHILAQDDHLKETTYSVFENEMHIAIKEAKHIIRSVELDVDAAETLNMKPGEPSLAMDRITFSKEDKVLEMMTFYYPTDTFQFEITLPRQERGLAVKLAEE